MVLGKMRYLFFIFSILSLSERFADCYLNEYADPLNNEIDFLMQIFHEFDKIVESVNDLNIYRRINLALMDGVKFHNYIKELNLKERVINELVSLERKNEVESNLDLKDLNPVSYAAVWIVQKTAAEYLVTFVRGFAEYKNKGETEEDKISNRVKAVDCWTIAAFIAAFLSYKPLALTYSNKFVELVEMVDRVQVPESIREIASTHEKVASHTKNIWLDFYEKQIYSGKTPNIHPPAFWATNEIQMLSSQYDSYFGNMLFGNNTKKTENIDESTIWNMANRLAEPLWKQSTKSTYKLTDLLRKLVMNDVTLDRGKIRKSGLKTPGAALKLLRGKRDPKDDNGNPAQEIRFAELVNGAYRYANGKEVPANSFDEF